VLCHSANQLMRSIVMMSHPAYRALAAPVGDRGGVLRPVTAGLRFGWWEGGPMVECLSPELL
jgi:hypothetical protein